MSFRGAAYAQGNPIGSAGESGLKDPRAQSYQHHAGTYAQVLIGIDKDALNKMGDWFGNDGDQKNTSFMLKAWFFSCLRSPNLLR